MREERLEPVRVLLPRSWPEVLEHVLTAGAAILTIAAALALSRGASVRTLVLLGVGDGVLAFTAVLIRALRRETVLRVKPTSEPKGTHTLPATPPQVVGRRLRLAQALRYLRRRENEARILAISGMPGVGKTALALAIAGHLRRTSYPDNQLLIGLNPDMTSKEALYEAFVQLRVPPAEIPADPTRWRKLYLEKLYDTRSLVVLDDACEADQVLELWPPGGCAAIATCRVEVGRAVAKGVRPVRLRPLGTLQALRFLANRIGRWRVMRQPVGSLRLVRLYGRLPLALEYVTGRLAVPSGKRLPLRAVLGRLRDRRLRLAFASAGADDSVALALDISYRGLIKEQQDAFCVFGLLDLPELDEEVVAAVLRIDPERAGKLLGQVADAGLLEPAAGGSGDRWQAHELARLYASLIVDGWPEKERREAIRRAVEVYLRRVKSLRELLNSPVAKLDPELAAKVRAELARRRQEARALAGRAMRIGTDLTASLAGDLVDLLLGIITDWPDPTDGGTSGGRAAPDRPTEPPGAGHQPRPSGRQPPGPTRDPEPLDGVEQPGEPDHRTGHGAPEPPPGPGPPPEPPTKTPRAGEGPHRTGGDGGVAPPPHRPPPKEGGAAGEELQPHRRPPGEDGDGSAGRAPHGPRPGGPPTDPAGRRSPQATDATTAGGVPVARDRDLLIGRDRDLEELQAALTGQHGSDAPRTALALITGTPAVGRWALACRLASQLADTYEDGILVVDLSPVGGEEPSMVDTLAGLLKAQGWPARALAAMTPDELERSYRAWFEGRRALVLVRNARDAAQVRPFLPVSPTSAVVVTSRSRLAGLATTVHCHLGPLAEADAVRLLALSSGRDDVAHDPTSLWLVRWFGCHPLLLRCVGAWMGDAARREVPVASLADALIDKGPPVRPGMDRELLRRLGRCGRLVPPSTARVYRLIALLDVRDVDADAVAAIAGITRAEAGAALTRLVDANLLERADPDSGRFRLHPLLRRLAAGRSIPWSVWQGRVALARVIEHYVGRLDPPSGVGAAAPAPGRATWFERNRPNLVAAVSRASELRLDTHAYALAFGIGRSCATLGYPAAWHRTAEVAVTVARRLRDPLAVQWAYVNLADALLALDRADDALLAYSGALARQLEHRTIGLEARVEAGRARAYHRKGALNEAITHYRSSLRLYEASSADRARLHLARLHGGLGDAYAAYAEADLIRHAANERYKSGRLYRVVGDLEAAEAAFLGALSALDEASKPHRREKLTVLEALAEVQQPLGHAPQAAASLQRLGNLHGLLEDPGAGALVLRESATLYLEVNDLPRAASALEDGARLHRVTGEHRLAAERLRRALQVHRALGDRSSQARIHVDLGEVYLDLGRNLPAAAAFRAGSSLYDDLRDPKGEARALCGLGTTYQRLNDHLMAAQSLDVGARLFDAADDIQKAAAAFRDAGKLYTRAGRPRAAVAALQSSISRYQKCEQLTSAREIDLLGPLADSHERLADPSEEVTARMRLGDLHEREGQAQQAAVAYLAGGVLFDRLHDRRQAAAAYSTAGRLSLAAGNPKAAVHAFGLAANLHHELDDGPGEAAARRGLGQALAQHGRFDEAASALKTSIDLYQKLGTTDAATAVADVGLEIGQTLRLAGRLEEAAATFRNGAERLAALGQHDSAARAYASSAAAEISVDRPAKAAADLDAAGWQAHAAQHPDAARAYFTRAMDLCQQHDLHELALKVNEGLDEVAPSALRGITERLTRFTSLQEPYVEEPTPYVEKPNRYLEGPGGGIARGL